MMKEFTEKAFFPCPKSLNSFFTICQENFTLVPSDNKIPREKDLLEDELSKLSSENLKLKDEIHGLRTQCYSNKNKHDNSPNTSKTKDLEMLENKISQVTDEFNLVFDKMSNYQKRLVEDLRKLKEILNMIVKTHQENKSDQLSFIISQLNYNSDLNRNEDYYLKNISETKNQIQSQLNILRDTCTINFTTESSNKASGYSTYSSKKKCEILKFQELKLKKGLSSESIAKKSTLAEPKSKLVSLTRQYSFDRTYSEMMRKSSKKTMKRENTYPEKNISLLC